MREPLAPPGLGVGRQVLLLPPVAGSSPAPPSPPPAAPSQEKQALLCAFLKDAKHITGQEKAGRTLQKGERTPLVFPKGVSRPEPARHRFNVSPAELITVFVPRVLGPSVKNQPPGDSSASSPHHTQSKCPAGCVSHTDLMADVWGTRYTSFPAQKGVGTEA